jgi:hypothetical protein
MDNKDIILIGQAIDGLSDARNIVRALVDRGVLPLSWQEIESVLDMILSQLSELEMHVITPVRSWPVEGL